jgi:hypothetical protein
MRWISRRINYANVVASIALFLALSGGAYAVAGNPFVAKGGAIAVCVEPVNHEMHAARTGANCPRGYTAIMLNRKGERGEPGPRGATGVTVYQGDIKNQSIVLGPQSKPTHIVDTPPLPAGTYLVSYSVGFVIGRLDNAVCAATPASSPGNDGVFGVAGNGATESGTGAAGIYGNGVAFDTIRITHPNDRISIFCNSANEKGTYVGGATIVAIPVQKLVIDHR